MSSAPANTLQDLRYPVGRYAAPEVIDRPTRTAWIEVLEALPANMRHAVAHLNESRLDTPYRPDGWTVRQVVHHVADSHLNSYIRFRLALTETAPAIKPYDEAAWAELADARTSPPDISLNLLEALHARWTMLLHAMSDEEFGRTVRHPELGEVRLDWMLGLYSWHSRHHVAHITSLRSRQGW